MQLPEAYLSLSRPVSYTHLDVYKRQHQYYEIKARKMQGVESNGMLCSGEELGLNDDLFPGSEVYGLLDVYKRQEEYHVCKNKSRYQTLAAGVG